MGTNSEMISKPKGVQEHYSGIIEYFDFAHHHSRGPTFAKGVPAIATHILKYKGTGNLLDIGCGDGQTSIFLAHNGFNVTGIDISSKAIEKANKLARELNVSEAEFVCANVVRYTPKRYLKVVLMHGPLFYILEDHKEAVIRKIIDHTAKRGLNALKYITSIVYEDEGMEYTFRFEQRLKQYYIKQGWKVLESEEGKAARWMQRSRGPLNEATEPFATVTYSNLIVQNK